MVFNIWILFSNAIKEVYKTENYVHSCILNLVYLLAKLIKFKK